MTSLAYTCAFNNCSLCDRLNLRKKTAKCLNIRRISNLLKTFQVRTLSNQNLNFDTSLYQISGTGSSWTDIWPFLLPSSGQNVEQHRILQPDIYSLTQHKTRSVCTSLCVASSTTDQAVREIKQTAADRLTAFPPQLSRGSLLSRL